LTIIDPSAASFIALLNKRSYYKVMKANNDVLDGIRETATAMHTGKLKINPDCENTVFEAQSYVWDEKAGEDRPVKVNDHAMDSMRYLAFTLHITQKKPTRYATID
jgi:phage terminase large subunit